MMTKNILLIIIILMISAIYSCKISKKSEPIDVYGCIDSTATNYDPEATIEDGSCEYDPIDIYGCIDSTANNFNPNATIDDSSCEYDPLDIYGCMDSTAANYNPEATIDDGSCNYCQVGSSFILISTDGGISWDTKCFKQKIGNIIDISIVDSENYWICTASDLNNSYGYILHTADSGNNWNIQFVDSVGSKNMDYIEMFDLNNGIALGDWSNTRPMLLKTYNGGQSWEITSTSDIGKSGDAWRRVDFIDIDTGYLFESGVSPQKMYKTVDSGASWEKTNFDGYSWILKFYDQDIGIAYENDSLVHRTKDGGNSWERISTDFLTHGDEDIEFDLLNARNVWLVTDDLYFSDDTGSTWIQCLDESIAGAVLNVTETDLWMFNYPGQLYKINKENCGDYEQVMLPEMEFDHVVFGYDIDIVGDVIVIPGYFYE